MLILKTQGTLIIVVVVVGRRRCCLFFIIIITAVNLFERSNLEILYINL